MAQCWRGLPRRASARSWVWPQMAAWPSLGGSARPPLSQRYLHARPALRVCGGKSCEVFRLGHTRVYVADVVNIKTCLRRAQCWHRYGRLHNRFLELVDKDMGKIAYRPNRRGWPKPGGRPAKKGAWMFARIRPSFRIEATCSALWAGETLYRFRRAAAFGLVWR